MSGLGSEQTLTRDAYRSSSTPRITGTHVPPIWVAITLPEPLSALAMSQLGRPISMPRRIVIARRKSALGEGARAGRSAQRLRCL
jgi:hypothetical protein